MSRVESRKSLNSLVRPAEVVLLQAGRLALVDDGVGEEELVRGLFEDSLQVADHQLALALDVRGVGKSLGQLLGVNVFRVQLALEEVFSFAFVVVAVCLFVALVLVLALLLDRAERAIVDPGERRLFAENASLSFILKFAMALARSSKFVFCPFTYPAFPLNFSYLSSPSPICFSAKTAYRPFWLSQSLMTKGVRKLISETLLCRVGRFPSNKAERLSGLIKVVSSLR